MNVSGPDFSNNGIRTESQLKLHKVMSAPTLLDGSESLDVDEEKIRKKKLWCFQTLWNHSTNSLFYYVLLFQVMGQHLLVFMEEKFFENWSKWLKTTSKKLEIIK